MLRSLVAIATLALFSTILPASTWVVDQSGGQDFTTIAAAVSAAMSGDTILIAAGTYQGAGNTNVDLAGKNLIIKSESGAAKTIIDCERIGPNTRAFYLHSGEDTTCVIEDITILRGYAISGAAIWCEDSSPKIVSCHFDSCGVAYGTVRLDNSYAKVIDCEFTDCKVFVAGGGMYVANSSPVIRGTTFERCSSEFLAGGYFHYEGGSSTLIDVTITDCVAGGEGAGALFEDAPPTLTRCDFVGNVSDSTAGGGMYINCDGTLTDCTFTANYAGQEGGGIYSWGSYLDLNNCTFTLNDASAGGGIYGVDALLDMDGGSFNYNIAGMGGGVCLDGGFPSFTSVDFAGDSAYIYGGGLASFDAFAQLNGCSFTGNYAFTGAGIYCDGLTAPTIHECTFSGNITEMGGSAILAEACNPTISNTIVAFTTNGSGLGCDFGASPTTNYSCFFGNDVGSGLCGSHSNNLLEDPLFCNAPSADIGLHDDSPCLPGGNPWGKQMGSEGAGGCGPSTGIESASAELALFPLRPNPTADSSTIRWAAPASAVVEVSIYDLSGRLVRKGGSTTAANGLGTFEWDGWDAAGHRAASGTYFVRARTGETEVRGRLALIR